MNKKVIMGNEAKELIKNTVIKLCDAVSMTLGPKGMNAIVDTDYSEPFVTNDGVTIAKNIEFDKKEEVVAKIIKESSIKTCDNAGDGTTTTLVLLKSIYLECLKHLENGISSFTIKESLNKYTNLVCDTLIKNSKSVSLKEIESIASISSGNKEIGNFIKKIVKIVGENGVIHLDESDRENNSYEIINGMYLDTGVVSSYMINGRKKESFIDNPYILVTDYKINDISEITNIIEQVKDKYLLIIAENYEDDVIDDLIRLYPNVVCVGAPNYSEKKKDILEDICIYTQSNLISYKYNKSLQNISLNDLGSSLKIKLTNKNIIIYKNNSINNELNERIEYVEKLYKEEANSFDKEVLEMRLSNLSSGLGIIYAGGKTHAEMILNKMRIEDAIYATKVAIKYGYSLGSGLSFYKISLSLINSEIGSKVLSVSLKEPFKKIIENSGQTYEKKLRELKNKSETIGYDALSNRMVDLETSGIIDPTKVLIESLKNAVSIANVLLTTNLIIVSNNKQLAKNITEII